MIKLKRPLASIDIEATGIDISKDRIVHLAIFKLIPDPKSPSLPYMEQKQIWKFNPGFPMSDEVIAVHGITNEVASTYEPMDSLDAKNIDEWCEDCDLVGFNSNNFDIPLLWEEMYRVGHKWDITTKHRIDVGNIFKIREERTLTAAMKFYCGKDHSGAHDALADATANLQVLDGQLARYKDLEGFDVEALAKMSAYDQRVDLAGIIVRNKDGIPVFNTKRNRGVPVRDDIGYARWFLKSDFTQNTKAVIEDLLMKINDGEPGLF